MDDNIYNTSVKLPPNLDLKKVNIASEWTFWLSTFEDYLLVTGKNKSSDEIKVSLLRNMMGPEASKILSTIPKAEKVSKSKYEDTINAITAYIIPRTNVVFERFKFNERKQLDEEPFDNYLTECRHLIKSCEFKTMEDELMRDHIVQTINNKSTQEALLRIDDLTLDKAIKFCQTREQASRQVLAMNPISVEAAGIKEMKPNIFKCKRCQTEHGSRSCPAFGKKCMKCGLLNHFAVSCHVNKNKLVREVCDEIVSDSESSNLFCGEVHKAHQLNSEWYENIFIENCKVTCKLDTGADVSIMSINKFNKINEKLNLKLLPTSIKLESFEGNHVKPIGMINLLCQYRDTKCYENFIIVNNCKSMLLGLPGCINLNLIKRVHSVPVTIPNVSKDKFIQDNIDVFKGIGKLPGIFEIPTRVCTESICYPSPRIPHALLEPLKVELQRLEKRNAIIKVENICNTACINKIVIVERPNKNIRLCLDPSDLNKIIVKKPKMLPTLDDLATKLKDKNVFSVLDLSEGFHHLNLSEEASWKCCFATPYGVYRYKVLPYGLMHAPELFQEVLETHFGNLPNVVVWADDILVMGNTMEEHDVSLSNVMKKAKQIGVVFNKDKLQYRQPEVKYVGQTFSACGMSIDKNRAESLVKLESPSNKEQLKSIIGSFSYIRRYVPDMGELMSPLCKLLKKDVEFTWLPIHETAFTKLKEKVSSAPALRPFDPQKKIILQCDASKNGLGGCLFQSDDKGILKLVACVSRTMNSAEQNYGQTEKELLAIYFTCKKFHKYIYGTNVNVQSDHKPIVAIMLKHISKLGSPRLRRLRLKLLIYNLNVNYVPGKLSHFADMLSRNSLKISENDSEMLQMVHTVSKHLPMSDERKDIFRKETNNDPVLNKICNFYFNGWPKFVPKDCKIFEKFRDVIYMQDGLLFIDNRLVVPMLLKNYILNILHTGHCGISKCLAKAKPLFYWPNMKSDIYNYVRKCRPCEKYSAKNCNEPLLPHKVPKERYIKVGCDILDFNGKFFLVIIDYFSHWIELLPITDKSSKSVINAMQDSFTRFGYPLEIITDNVPFSSFDCKSYFKSKDIVLVTSTPRYPKSNGMAEKAVHICKQILRKCKDDGTDYREGLLHYNNTPLSGLDISPSQILNSKRARIMPCNNDSLKPKVQNGVYNKLLLKQSLYKMSYDKSASKSVKDFVTGENVVFRDGNIWTKAKVIGKSKEPRSYIIRKENSYEPIRRNSSQMKKSFTQLCSSDNLIDDECVDIPENTSNAQEPLQISDYGPSPNVPIGRPYTTRSGRTVKPRQVLDL